MSIVGNPLDYVRIDRSALPEKECEAAESIERNLSSLASLTDGFRLHVDMYLDLFLRKQAVGRDDPNELLKFVAWMRGAARLGALDAYSFSMVMQAVNETKAPTIWAKSDMEARKRATKLFAAEFPLIAAVRQAAAHVGELSKSAAEENRHRLKQAVENERMLVGPDSGIFMPSFVHAEPNRAIYSATFQGKMSEYELSDAKADALATVSQLYRETFYPLEHPSAAAQRASHLEFDLWRAKQETPGPRE
jgi:hypothetical protein